MGMGPIAMAVVLCIFALLLIGAFAAAWRRDKSRSNGVSDDHERLEDHERHRLGDRGGR